MFENNVSKVVGEFLSSSVIWSALKSHVFERYGCVRLNPMGDLCLRSHFKYAFVQKPLKKLKYLLI